MNDLHGLFGRPYLDMEPFVDARGLDALDDEIPYALSLATTSYTGGSLKWMGVVAPWAMDDGYVDYGHAIEEMNEEEFRRFVSLADDPNEFDLAKRETYRFGDETDHPLTPAQMRFLEYRHGVYFPWKVCYHLLENDKWDDKHSGHGKSFEEEARRLFPKTIAFIEALPFREIGRAVIFGLLANDHAPAHRDTEPGKALSVAQSISFDPRGKKRFYLQGPHGGEKTPVDARMYWFNDMDYHGVDPASEFQYSVRVDGTFDPAFITKLQRKLRR